MPSPEIAAGLKSQGIVVARETLCELLAQLEDAFLLQAIPGATDSEKRRQFNPHKIYPVDPATGPVFDRSQKQNQGHALEVAFDITEPSTIHREIRSLAAASEVFIMELPCNGRFRGEARRRLLVG